MSPLYRPVELVPGVELRLERGRAGGPREVLTTLDERALEELEAAAREARE